jgi:hypothetical protein
MENENDWFLKIWVMLSDQDPDRDKIIMEHPKIRHEDTDLGS